MSNPTIGRPRICDECPGGKVWISESTYAVVKDQVLVEKTNMKAKGHEGEGTVVYLLLGFK
jgi:class 3 adenylate cyclase